MTIIRNITLNLKYKEILRRQGIDRYSSYNFSLKEMIRELLTSLKTKHILQPAIEYSIHRIMAVRHERLYLESGTVLHGKAIPLIMTNARELAVLVCTIGPTLEKEVTYYLNKNESLNGFLLDAIGSAAVDSLAQEACKFMAHEALDRGYRTSSPLSPGMLGLPISQQKQLFKLVPANKIGISLTSAGVMIPLKSLSMIIGMGLVMKTWTQAEVCMNCNLNKTCLHRVRLSK